MYTCRVPAFFPVVRIGSPKPLTHKGVLLLSPYGPREETHSLAGEGVSGPNSDEGTDTLVLYVFFNSGFLHLPSICGRLKFFFLIQHCFICRTQITLCRRMLGLNPEPLVRDEWKSTIKKKGPWAHCTAQGLKDCRVLYLKTGTLESSR
jgi:hypothetical protein